jgi:hypothetical protein
MNQLPYSNNQNQTEFLKEFGKIIENVNEPGILSEGISSSASNKSLSQQETPGK